MTLPALLPMWSVRISESRRVLPHFRREILQRFGDLIKASHRSLRDLYEVKLPRTGCDGGRRGRTSGLVGRAHDRGRVRWFAP